MRIYTALMLFLICSCSENKESNEQPVTTYDTSTLYYDIPLSIKNEIAEIKRTFAYTYKLTIEGTKRDSTEIDSITLLQLASPFLQLNLNDKNIRKYYKESVFGDGDTESIVLNYSTDNPELPVRSVSVLLHPETQQFKRMDILKAYASGDTTFEERLAWSANKNFQIIQIASTKDAERTKQIYVNWKQR
jgi:hypothetical protein